MAARLRRLRCAGVPRAAAARSRPSSIEPTSVRTMCRKNEFAVISNASTASPSSTHCTALHRPHEVAVLGLGGRERAEVVLAEQHRAFSFSAATSSGRGHQSDRLASNTERSRRPPDAIAIRPRPRVETGAERRPGPPRPALTATSSGRTVFNARAARSAGGPPSTSTETTFASACTPVSVRPATVSSLHVPVELCQRPAQLALDRARGGLSRPAAKAGAVVLDRQLEPHVALSVEAARSSGAPDDTCKECLML